MLRCVIHAGSYFMLNFTNTSVDGIDSPPNWPEGIFPHTQTFIISTCTIINHAQRERTGARICFPVFASNQPRSAFCLVSVPGVCLLQRTHCSSRCALHSLWTMESFWLSICSAEILQSGSISYADCAATTTTPPGEQPLRQPARKLTQPLLSYIILGTRNAAPSFRKQTRTSNGRAKSTRN